MEKLAIDGGNPLRERPLPGRRLFGRDELQSIIKVFEDSWQNEIDFGYQGKYEKQYTDAFCKFQGGGYADAVSSGTAALFIALSALDIVRGDEVLFSPVTDSGGISPALLLGMVPVIADAQSGGFNIGPDEFEAALTLDTKAAIIVHSGGIPVELDPIMEIAASKGIKIIEDCSQAHGALYKGKQVGRFGDIGIFSTMFSKNHATGGCGGIVYTKDEGLYWRIRSLADRGKPFYREFDSKDPDEFLFPGMNFNQDELSCAIGTSTLFRLPGIIEKRNGIVRKVNEGLFRGSSVVSPVVLPSYITPSPFFHTLWVDVDRLGVPKKRFAEAVRAEGIWVNSDYRYVITEWGWMKKYLKRGAATPNAVAFRDGTFNLLFNERFSDDDIRDVVSCIIKVENAYQESFDYR